MTIQNQTLRHTRGDTGSLTVRRQLADGTPAPFLPGDILYFTVKYFPGCTHILLQKTVTEFEPDGTAIIALNPEDTRPLEFLPYCYDIQLNDRDGGVTTLAGPATFAVGGEVTHE